MNKFLPIVLGSSLLIPGLSQAVGLGAIKVNSTLNQPLEANIRLLSLRGASLSDVNAVLASPAQFKRLNLESSGVLALLKFEVSKDKRGKPIIHITSKEPITEPYIQLLLDVKWPKGQLLRSYNILLDPPNYIVSTQKSRQLPRRASQQKDLVDAPIEVVRKESKTVAQPTNSIVTAQSAPTNTPVQAKAVDHHLVGPISETDSLWDIARRVPRGDKSLNQVMVAIVKKNPHAFIRGNMNGLKRGIKIALPTTQELQTISQSFANQELVRHAGYWKRGETVPASKATQLVQRFNPAQPSAKQASAQPSEPTAVTAQAADRMIEEQASAPTDNKQFTAAALPTTVKKTLAQAPTATDASVSADAAASASLPVGLNETPAGAIDSEVAELEKMLNRKRSPVQVQEHQNRVTDIEKSPLLKTSSQSSKLENTLRAELALSAEATAIAREKNAILQQQMEELAKQNRQLIADVSQRNQEIQTMRLEMTKLANVISQRDNQLSAQAYMKSHDAGMVSSYKLLIATLIMLVGGSSYAWYRRVSNATTTDTAPKPTEPSVNVSENSQASANSPKENLVIPIDDPRVIVPTKIEKEEFSSKHPEVSFSTFEPKKVPVKKEKVDFSQNMKDEPPPPEEKKGIIDFEAGLYDKSKAKKIKYHGYSDVEEENEKTHEKTHEKAHEVQPEASVYERKLKLAKQHMKVHDFHEAYIILTDIIDNGEEMVAKQAQELLDQMQR